MYKAIYEPTSYDRIVFNESLKNKLYASGLATDITGWSVGKAEALARSIGADLHNFTSLRMIMNLKGVATRIGWFGAGISTIQLGIGIYEHQDDLTKEDALNALQVVFGIAGIFAGPWWALGFGTVSLIIAYNSRPQ